MKLFMGILAGGNGERLWPLSTQDHPKQLIPFIHNKSLLRLTAERLTQATNFNNDIFIVASTALTPLLKKNVTSGISFFIEEPAPRNTAAAILLSCLEVYKRNPEAVVAFFPADHFIPDAKAFGKVVTEVVDYVSKHEVIATLGLKPTYPATGYGYIQASGVFNQEKVSCYPVSQFHEKPDFTRAQLYLHSDDMFWNAGMFFAKAAALLKEFELHASSLWQDMQLFCKGHKAYNELEKISVDYAIMEKSNNIVVFPTSFEWYDVGNVHTFLTLKNKFEQSPTRQITIDAHNNLASTHKKMVVWIGVQNLCVIETADELLVVSQEQAEDVKKVVHYLNNEINSST